MWKISLESTAVPVMAIMANTIDAAPRIPDQATKICWRKDERKGVKIPNTASGLAIKVRKRAIKSAVHATPGNLDGKDKSPSRKNKNICISVVSPPKKSMMFFLFGSLAFPSIIPAIYTER